MRLPIFRHEFRGFHVVRFPIEVEYLVLRPQKIFRVSMAFKTPGHALGLRMVNNRHVVDLTMTAKTTDAAVDVGAVIVKNIIRGAMDLHPFDRAARFPAGPHRLEFRIVLLHLGVAVHACLRGGQIRVCRHIDETVAVTAIHSELRHVNIMRKRHRLNRFIPHPGVLWRHVIPSPRGQPAYNQHATDGDFKRQPVRPAWKKIRHGFNGCGCCATPTAKLKMSKSSDCDVLRSNAGNVEVDRRGTARRQLYESSLHWQKKIRGSTLSQENCGASLPLWRGLELPELITSKLRHTVK
jgi:hypothetical protein